MVRSHKTLGIVAMVSLLLTACGPQQAAVQPAPEASSTPAQAEVTFIRFQGGGDVFNPQTLVVKVGTTVTWINPSSDRPHTATADDGMWDSGPISPGGTYSRVFDQPGTFTWHCYFDASSVPGEIIVTQ
jgi:plastocyanin